MKWIPVTERLPLDDLDIVLVTVKDNGTSVVKIAFMDDGKWVDAFADSDIDSGVVVAWMSFPEPFLDATQVEWISVTDITKLPENSLDMIFVLVQDFFYLDVLTVYMDKDGDWYDAISGECYGSRDDRIMDVVAWMPFPKPYSGTP